MMGAVDAMATYIGTAGDGVADDEVADNGLANNDCVLVDEALRDIFSYDRTVDDGHVIYGAHHPTEDFP